MKVSRIVLYIIVAISVVVMGLFYFGGGSDQALSEAANADLFYVPNYTSIAINLAIALLITSILAALVLAIWGFIQAPKQSAKSLIGVALLGAIVLIAYLSSDITPIKLSDGTMFTDAFRLELADVCIISSGILLVLTLISIAAAWVMKLTK